MKDYVSMLFDEELTFICKIIGGKYLNEHYKKNSKSFNKLQPGYRPGSLSDENAFKFAINNKNISFVKVYLNSWIEGWLKEIEEYKAEQLKEAGSEEIALVNTLSLSVFEKKPEIYFKLTETVPPVSDTSLFYKLIEMTAHTRKIGSDTEKNGSNADDMQKAVEAIQDKKDAEIKKISEACEKELADKQAKVEELQKTVEQREKEIDTLQSELNCYKDLAAYKLPIRKIERSDDYPYQSLFKVYTDYNGESRLHRLADIYNGDFSNSFISEAPEHKNLYRKDGPDRIGYIGVWNWKNVPNNNDPTKDYIITSFNDSAEIIELVVLNDCKNIFELIEMMKNGISYLNHTNSVIFAVCSGSLYEGIYCDEGSFTIQTDRIILKPETLKLPVYEIPKEIVYKAEEITVIVQSWIGMPSRIVKVREPLDLVRNLIISRASWTAMKQKGFIRNEYKQIREFLTELSTSELHEEICHICDCSMEEAKKFVDDFINHSDIVASGCTLENKIMAQIIRNDESMYNDCMDELSRDWENAHQEQVQEAESELNIIKAEALRYKEQCDEQQKQYELLEGKINNFNSQIAKQEQLAQEVQTRVFEKIEQAKQNAAEFIAENAFVHINSSVKDNKESTEALIKNNQSLFFASQEFLTDNPDENMNYEQLLQTIQSELLEAGVADSSINGLSAVLYSAFINRIPLLLSGPNSNDIATAFAVSLYCRTPSIIKCEGEYNSQAIKDCEDSEEKIVVIEQPFQSGWENGIVNLISKRDRFYIIVHPFAEDLVIEPRGLFNYCTPILTEMFVDKLPTGKYMGGYKASDFREFIPITTERCYEKLLTSIRLSSISKYNIQTLISNSKAMLDSYTVDDNYRILLYSISFVLGEAEQFSKWLENTKAKPSTALCDTLKNLMGDYE